MRSVRLLCNIIHVSIRVFFFGKEDITTFKLKFAISCIIFVVDIDLKIQNSVMLYTSQLWFFINKKRF